MCIINNITEVIYDIRLIPFPKTIRESLSATDTLK